MMSDMLSQEEIDALLNGDVEEVQNDKNDTMATKKEATLSDTEKDTLGEVGNISMGTAATTLFTLLGKKVLITTPKVTITNTKELANEYPKPFVAVDVRYTVGLQGGNLLVLKEKDVKVITDLMMGGDGSNTDRELNEMDMSAISEAMNQMVGSSSTSLSEIFSKKIDIAPPAAYQMSFDNGIDGFDTFNNDEDIIKISFNMVIGDVIDSEIMQLLPLKFSKNLINGLLNSQEESTERRLEEQQQQPLYTTENPVDSLSDNSSNNDQVSATMPQYEQNQETEHRQHNTQKQRPINVKKVDFKAFDKSEKMLYNESIDMIQDIPVEITVELGRTKRKIREILEYGPGTIIELDKVVGEPLEIFANGKYIAKGEVVVIDDNFGIRVTDIVNPSKRVN